MMFLKPLIVMTAFVCCLVMTWEELNSNFQFLRDSLFVLKISSVKHTAPEVPKANESYYGDDGL